MNPGSKTPDVRTDLAALFSAELEKSFPKTAAPALSAPALPGASAALTALHFARRSPARFVLLVAPTPAASQRVASDFAVLAKQAGVRTAELPPRAADDPEADGTRLKTVRALQYIGEGEAEPLAVVACVQALAEPVPDPERIRTASVFLKRGGAYEISELAAKLADAGYTRGETVDAPGTFSVRGGIFDVWPPSADEPWRAEFFDSELESLRLFDPLSQRSTGDGEMVWLPPCGKAAEGRGAAKFSSLLPKQSVIVWLDNEAIAASVAELAAGREAPEQAWSRFRGELTAQEPSLEIFSGDPAPAGVASWTLPLRPFIGLAELGAEETRSPELLASAREKLLRGFVDAAAEGREIWLCLDTPGAAESINRDLLRLVKRGRRTPRVKRLPLSGGFALGAVTVAAQDDLFAVRRRARLPVRRTAPLSGERVTAAADLEPGDLVVHVEYGIGRYLGTTEIGEGAGRVEVMTVEYADEAKVHVPVTQAHLLSRYVGVAGHRVRLHRLGGSRWKREKESATVSVRSLAAALLETQAKREIVDGVSFDPEPPWMREFEASFPYSETPDQTRAIDEVKRDMASPRPMDRLICGDAGYGKTEVAMRAAFVAVMNGRQVAVLVPTTVLAEQHYDSFRERMADYPVEIAIVDRFRGRAGIEAAKAAAKSGAADIVIGTHALLAADFEFKNLGLLIIDEEQRFGVAHKERLKVARQMVDVLTMSATPIPRTLYMSMTGARDMSLLQTPPRERVAVETRVARDSDEVLAEAIRFELARDGQVFVLHNRVATIGRMAERLRKLVPEAVLAVAHARMSSEELSEVMRSFQAGACDVLLCTTIVESGLDIPRANTMIVMRADRFGIADLYQLRGRVGRSSRRGYAWFMLPETGFADSDARERLAALKKHSGLGAGYGLALRDLEIRGAGNLLGREQSGQIAAVGFGLYCQLLKRTIALLKGKAVPLLADAEVFVDFVTLSPGAEDDGRLACLPYGYIEDESQRIAFHRKLASISSEGEIEDLRKESADRYGRPPAPVLRLLKLAEIRVRASRAGLRRVEARDGKIFRYRRESAEPLFDRGRLPRVSGATTEARLASVLRVVGGK